MFFVVLSNDSFNFPLGLIKYIVIVLSLGCPQTSLQDLAHNFGSFTIIGWFLEICYGMMYTGTQITSWIFFFSTLLVFFDKELLLMI